MHNSETNFEDLMILAVKKQRPSMLEKLVISGANIDELIWLDGYNFSTLLHYAVEMEYIDMVEKIIDLRGDLNIVDSNWRTPLHLACVIGNAQVVKLLIESGAELNVADKRGKMPLDYARDASVVKLMRAKGAHEQTIWGIVVHDFWKCIYSNRYRYYKK